MIRNLMMKIISLLDPDWKLNMIAKTIGVAPEVMKSVHDAYSGFVQQSTIERLLPDGSKTGNLLANPLAKPELFAKVWEKLMSMISDPTTASLIAKAISNYVDSCPQKDDIIQFIARLSRLPFSGFNKTECSSLDEFLERDVFPLLLKLNTPPDTDCTGESLQCRICGESILTGRICPTCGEPN